MPLGIDFGEVFCRFWEAQWTQVGTKIDHKSIPIAKSDFLKNRASNKTTVLSLHVHASALDSLRIGCNAHAAHSVREYRVCRACCRQSNLEKCGEAKANMCKKSQTSHVDLSHDYLRRCSKKTRLTTNFS